MIQVLIAKDLRRARRNPLPWLINLIVPLTMTALIGLVFGGKSDGGSLGKIRFAVVNEDKEILSDMMRIAAGGGQGSQYLDPIFTNRAAAMREVNAGNISAVLIIPTNFVSNYLTASTNVSLELVKNPAESIHPAVLEELLGTLVTGLNTVSRNFNSEFPAWKTVFAGGQSFDQVSSLVQRAGDKFKDAKKFISPPLVGYTKDEPAKATNSPAANDTAKADTSGATSNDNIFAYLLIGLSGMFLVFIGSNAMADLHRELRMRTFERYQTLQQQLWPFIVGKVIFAIVVVVLCSAILLGGGGLIFGFRWEHPLLLLPLMFGYACFVAALFALLAALIPDERRAAVMNNIASMTLGLVGGCAFPPHQLPAFLRDHVTPLLPSYWFADTLRTIEYGSDSTAWLGAFLKLVLVAALLIGVATVLFRRRFQSGLRA